MADSEKKPKKRDPVVYKLSKSSRCYNCDSKLVVNDIVKLQQNREDEREVLCGQCAGLAEYAFVPKGDAALTREATKQSQTRFVVMKWSELWKCYEREGILVEQKVMDALKKA